METDWVCLLAALKVQQLVQSLDHVKELVMGLSLRELKLGRNH